MTLFIVKLPFIKTVKVEEFKRDEVPRHEKSMILMRSITNYVMGIVLAVIGIGFLFPIDQTKDFLDKYDPLAIRLLGIVCIIYGIFRLYRGYRKNYFRNS